MEEQLTVGPLDAVLMNFNRKNIKKYEETVCTLVGMGRILIPPRSLILTLRIDLHHRRSHPLKSHQC